MTDAEGAKYAERREGLASEVIHHPLDSVLEMKRLEVDQETYASVHQLEVRQQLCAVKIVELFPNAPPSKKR